MRVRNFTHPRDRKWLIDNTLSNTPACRSEKLSAANLSDYHLFFKILFVFSPPRLYLQNDSTCVSLRI